MKYSYSQGSFKQSDEFKEKILRIMQRDKLTLPLASERWGIPINTLSRWKRERKHKEILVKDTP